MKHVLLLFLTLATGCLLAQATPKYHYRFDDEALTDSIGACNGKVQRLKLVEGLYGKAYYFPAEDSQARNVACSTAIPIPPEFFTKPFTATLWLKLDENNSYRLFKDLLCIGKERGPGFRLTYFYNSLHFRSGDGKKPTTIATNSSTVLLPVKRWFQIAVVYDGETASIYIDGVLKASGKIQLTLGKGPLSVGTYGNGYAYPAQGAIDELKIYDVALSHPQIVEAFLQEMK